MFYSCAILYLLKHAFIPQFNCFPKVEIKRHCKLNGSLFKIWKNLCRNASTCSYNEGKTNEHFLLSCKLQTLLLRYTEELIPHMCKNEQNPCRINSSLTPRGRGSSSVKPKPNEHLTSVFRKKRPPRGTVLFLLLGFDVQ